MIKVRIGFLPTVRIYSFFITFDKMIFMLHIARLLPVKFP